MVDEGETAPRFELPAVRDGEFERIALGEYLGEDVVILAFYPGDFNPACDDTTTGLDALDLFTMQKDITILAISGDSVYSHRAFAEQYDLHIPLLSDVRGEVATEYGVAAEDEPYLTHRAVFVIDHSEHVEYTWVADDVETMPDTDEIRAAIENVGDDQTARARYRVGHAHYVEGRRAFTSAMSAFEDREWMLSSRDFTQAVEEFDEARDEFNTAVRFSDDEEATRYFERAERKAEALWRAAGWLDDAAASFASGEGRRGEELREDAEGPLETARDIHEPPNPDDFPPEEDPRRDEAETSFLPSDDEEVDTSLALDESAIDDEATAPGDAETGENADDTGVVSVAEEGADVAGDAAALAGGDDSRSMEGQGETDGESVEVAQADGDETLVRGGNDGGNDKKSESESDEEGPESDIDDEELEAITAELEEQNEDQDDTPVEEPGDDTSAVEGNADVEGVEDVEDEDLELELTDPKEGEEEDEVDHVEDNGGDHGVPDSL